MDLTGRAAQKSSRLELAAAAVAAGDGTAPMPVTQGWKDIIRHITMIEQMFEKINDPTAA